MDKKRIFLLITIGFLLSINMTYATCPSCTLVDDSTKVQIVNGTIYNITEVTNFYNDTYTNISPTSNLLGAVYPIQTNSSANDANALFTVMSDTRGTPQFLVQDGGPNQASFITRSFMVVNQNNTLLNSSQNNLCSSWGFTHLDCNTSTTGADFGVTDDIQALGQIYATGGLSSHATDYGAYLVLDDDTTKYSGSNGEFNSTTNKFCDYTTNNFADTGGWVTINDETSDYVNAHADINAFINTSCVELKNNPAWTDDFTGLTWSVQNNPDFIVQQGGFMEYYVGNGSQSGARFKIKDGKGDYGFSIDAVAGTNSYSPFYLNVDLNEYNGVSPMLLTGYSSTGGVDIEASFINIVGDGTGYDNSTLGFMSFDIVGSGGEGNELYGISMPAGLTDIIKIGTSETLSVAWFDNTTSTINITAAVTSGATDITLFEEDNSILYIGNKINFTTIGVSLNTESSASITAQYFYCNGSSDWESLTISNDFTNGFQNTGSITFNNPINRGECNKEIDGTPFSDVTNYTYIAIKRTKNNIINPPIENLISISSPDSPNFRLKEDLLKLSPKDTAPETCDISVLGAIYFDISEDNMCVCKSGGWFVIQDGSACT